MLEPIPGLGPGFYELVKREPALTLGGYLPFDCPVCHRRRLEWFRNSAGALCYCKCEKCGANSEDDSLSPTRRVTPSEKTD